MGLGILSAIKPIIPISIIVVSVFLILRAMAGRLEWALMLLIMLLPLRNVVDKLHSYPLGKDLIDIFFMCMLVGLFTQALRTKEKLFEGSPLNIIAGILIMFTFVSLLQGSVYLSKYSLFSISDPRVRIWKNYCMLPLLYIITLNSIKDRKWVWRTVFVMCFTIAFMDYYTFRQVTMFHNIESRTKIHGTFVYLGPNEVAAFYNQYTIILMSLYFSMKKNWKKVALLGIIVINLYCILFLFSRAAYAAFAVGMFFLFAIKKKVLLIPLMMAVIMWQAFLPQQVQDRIEMTTNAYGELDVSSERRLIVWQDSLDLFYESPIIGVGFGAFRHLGMELGDTHNIYLKVLAEQGIVGMFILLILLFIMFIQGIKLFLGGDDPMSKALGLGFAVAIIVLFINNMFGDRWTYMEVSSYLWVFAALVTRLNIITKENSSANNEKKSKKELNKKYGLNGI